MTENRYGSADDILQDPSGEIGNLRKMGITNAAILAYVRRVREGKNKEEALLALLRGRSLSSQQVSFVREAVERLPIQAKPSSEAGFLRLGPSLIALGDRYCDADSLFFGGLFLLLSPVLTSVFLQPSLVLCLMLAGLLASAAALGICRSGNSF